MHRLRKTFVCFLAIFTMFFFVGCGNNSQSENPPSTNNPDYSIVDSDVIGDQDAKRYFAESTDLILNYISKINSLLLSNSSISNSHDFVSVSDLIELILNKAVFVKNERIVYQNKENELSTENVYAKISKFSSKINSNFARLSVKSGKQGITFSLVSESASNELILLNFDVKLKNEEIESVNFKYASQEDKNFSIFGFKIVDSNNTIDLFFGQPETSDTDMINFIFNGLYNDLDNCYWSTCMACTFNFSTSAVVLPFISTGKRVHVKTSSISRFKQCLVDLNFKECCLVYTEFDALYENKKTIENDKTKLLFDNLKTEYVKYNPQDNIFVVI